MARGTVRPRRDGNGYEAVYDLGPDPISGKRRQRSKSFPIKRAANAFLNQMQAEIDKGTAVDPSRQTLGEYLQYWLTTIVKHKVRPTTYDRHEGLIRVHILPALGNVPLQKLAPTHLQGFYAALITNGRKDGRGVALSPRSARYCHVVIRAALQHALKAGLVARNVADAAEPPKASRPQVRYWDAEQARRFVQVAAQDAYGPIWVVALATGMRRGELLGLRWQDLDLDRGVAQIRQTVVESRSNVRFAEPKTAAGRRKVDLSPTCAAMLRDHHTRQKGRMMRFRDVWQDHDLIFPNEIGGPINPHNLNRRFLQHVRAAGVPRIRIHDLRHTSATLDLANGTNVKVVSERLGHANISITLSTYAHTLPTMQREAADALDSTLFGEKPDEP